MKVLNKEQGASSVLIVVMMMVLIVFGLAIFTTALSNMRLADKKVKWLKEYYKLEQKASITLAKIDHIINDTNVKNTTFKTFEPTLSELMKKNATDYTYEDDPEQIFDKIIQFNIASEDTQRKKNITLSIGIHFNRQSEKTFSTLRILSFKQWQEAFELDNVFDLE